MITLALVLLTLVVIFVMFKKAMPAFKKINDAGGVWAESKKFWTILGVGLFLLIASFVQPFDYERINGSHVGIKVNLTGDNRGISKYEYKTGWVVYNTWISQLYEFPTYQQHVDYEPVTMITKGGFNATVKPSFNYAVKPGEVGDMFQNLRLGIKDIEKGWLNTAIISSMNDVTNRWNVDDIFNHREQFESDIIAECNKRTAKWFTISQLRTNITPPEALQSSIIAKTKAIQEVQVAENQRAVAVAEGQRKIAEAQADSAAAVIAAAGRAEAIKKEQLSLTPLYIDYIKTQKWNGVTPSVVGGGSNGFILSLTK